MGLRGDRPRDERLTPTDGLLEILKGWVKRRWAATQAIAPVIVPVVYLEWAIWIGLMLVGLVDSAQADSTADWLAAAAARDGLNPYGDLREIQEHYAVRFESPAREYVEGRAWLHPRTPGALLLLQPVTLVDTVSLFGITIFVSFALLAYLSAFLLPRATGWSWTTSLSLGALLILSGPVVRTTQFGAMGLLIAVLLWWFWLGIRTEDRWWAGIPLGIAITFKLFPALLLIPTLAFRRFRATATSVATSVVLMVAGMVVLGLTPGSVVDGMTEAGDIWSALPSNASISARLALALELEVLPVAALLTSFVALGMLLLTRSGGDLDLVISIAFVSMLLISPLSWEANDVLLLLPVALGLNEKGDTLSRWVAVAWLSLAILGYYALQSVELTDPIWAGRRSLTGRFLLLVGLAVMAWRQTRNQQLDSGVPDLGRTDVLLTPKP